ncbi:MAG: glycosyltransferase, partial [Vicinamibacterales bacterium]
MRRVLIVSPHFPPVNAPDMQRVRMSLPYFVENGWQPWVLTVASEYQDAPIEPALAATIPDDVPVVRTRAIPLRLTKPLGIGNVGIRAFWHLYRAGSRLIREQQIDLVYFSTTMFAALPLGRLWKQRLGVPYVIDFQDPWFSTYYDDKPVSERPPKHGLARRLHATLEPWTMKDVSGVVAVSEAYLETLQNRYPWLARDMCATIPFGASERDFEIAGSHAAHSDRARSLHECVGLSIGRGGADMATAVRILFRALRDGQHSEALLSSVRLRFVGTDYARDDRSKPTITPIAAAESVGGLVSETPSRIGYLDSLSAMRSTDFLILIGSDDPQYSPSKIYPYILSRKPIVAVLHERSPLVDLLRRLNAGPIVTFAGRDDVVQPARSLASQLSTMLPDVQRSASAADWTVASAYSARRLTRLQCRLFDAVLEPQTS